MVCSRVPSSCVVSSRPALETKKTHPAKSSERSAWPKKLTRI
jgi:hypothetical protein